MWKSDCVTFHRWQQQHTNVNVWVSNILGIKLCLNTVCIRCRRLRSGPDDWSGSCMLHSRLILVWDILLPASSIVGPPMGCQAYLDSLSGICIPSSFMWRCLFSAHTLLPGCFPAQSSPFFTQSWSWKGKFLSRCWWNSESSFSVREHTKPPAPNVDLISFRKFCLIIRDSVV